MGLWGPRVATVTTPVPSLSLGQSEQFPAHPADKAMAGTLAHTRPHTHCGKSGSYSVGCRIPAGNTAERAWSAGDPSHLPGSHGQATVNPASLGVGVRRWFHLSMWSPWPGAERDLEGVLPYKIFQPGEKGGQCVGKTHHEKKHSPRRLLGMDRGQGTNLP